MCDAFTIAPIIDRLQVNIESLACWGSRLLVGTKDGLLLVYDVQPNLANPKDEPFSVTLLESKKSFAKKPIMKLVVVEEYGLLLSLSDNCVFIHELATFALRMLIPKTRGATYFAVNNPGEDALVSRASKGSLRLCAVVKKKLELFIWRNNEFAEEKDLSLPDVPRIVYWCGDSICVGFKKEYNLIQTKAGAIHEVFSTGPKVIEPLITSLIREKTDKEIENERRDRGELNGGANARKDNDEREKVREKTRDLLLLTDNMTVFCDGNGKPSREFGVQWSGVPLALEVVSPFLLALLQRHLEVRTINTQFLVQKLELPSARILAFNNDSIYCASTTHVWRLRPTKISAQVDQLMKAAEYEEALNLAEFIDDMTVAEKTSRIAQINTLYAYDLFVKRRFEQSLMLFSKLALDPIQVIGLFPNFLPQELRKQFTYPMNVPVLEGAELEKAVLALIEFLTDARIRLKQQEIDPARAVPDHFESASKRELSQIIDTTLLKCYLQSNDAMVGPLLRVANNCHLGESEKMLRQKEKWSELVVLLQSKGEHTRALQLLKSHGESHVGPLAGVSRTVNYLQRLGSEHFGLIKEFSTWVLQSNPQEGLKIFTGDFPEVDTLPRDLVLEHLMTCAPDTAIPYLEHIIDVSGETGAFFHNKRVMSYLERVEQLIKGGSRDGKKVRAGAEDGELGQVRSKLVRFLETSAYYEPEKMLSRFPKDALYEERAVLLAKIGRHERALAIYVHKLRDFAMAEEYCNKHYNKDKEDAKDVYVTLLKVHLAPSDGEPPNLPPALTLLAKYYAHIDTVKALAMLPPSTPVLSLYPFIERVLVENSRSRHRNQVLLNLLKSEQCQVQEQLKQQQQRRVVIGEERVCISCRKRIGNSVFACYPHNEIVHHMCKDRYEEAIRNASTTGVKK